MKRLFLALILLSGCSTSLPSAPQQTPTVEQAEEDPTTSWMTPKQKERNEVDPFPEYTDIEGYSPQKNKGGEPDLEFYNLDPVFKDNIGDPLTQHIQNYLTEEYPWWCHVYKKDGRILNIGDRPEYFQLEPGYLIRMEPGKKSADAEFLIHQYTDEEDGLLTLRIEMPEYELMSPFYQDIFDPFLPKACKTEDMQIYFFNISDHYEDDDLEFEEEFPEIYGTKKFIIDHSGDSEKGCKYILEYKTKSSYIYDKIKDSGYEVH